MRANAKEVRVILPANEKSDKAKNTNNKTIISRRCWRFDDCENGDDVYEQLSRATVSATSTTRRFADACS